MLQALLARDDEDDRDLEAITSDQQLNHQIARNEEELQFYQSLDAARPPSRLPRLMQENELPDCMSLNTQPEEAIGQYGRGARGLQSQVSDSQFFKRMEEEAKRSYQLGRQKGAGAGAAQTNGAAVATAVPATQAAPKPKGRPRKKEPRDLTGAEKYSTIWAAVLEQTQNGRRMATPFLERPDAKDFPDYDDLILTPLGLSDVKQRITDYRDPRDFRRDMNIVFQNARDYNSAGTRLFEDATYLQKFLEDQFTKHFPELPDSSGHSSDVDKSDD